MNQNQSQDLPAIGACCVYCVPDGGQDYYCVEEVTLEACEELGLGVGSHWEAHVSCEEIKCEGTCSPFTPPPVPTLPAGGFVLLSLLLVAITLPFLRRL